MIATSQAPYRTPFRPCCRQDGPGRWTGIDCQCGATARARHSSKRRGCRGPRAAVARIRRAASSSRRSRFAVLARRITGRASALRQARPRECARRGSTINFRLPVTYRSGRRAQPPGSAALLCADRGKRSESRQAPSARRCGKDRWRLFRPGRARIVMADRRSAIRSLDRAGAEIQVRRNRPSRARPALVRRLSAFACPVAHRAPRTPAACGGRRASVEVTGNLKFDVEPDAQCSRARLAQPTGRAGDPSPSTREGEERAARPRRRMRRNCCSWFRGIRGASTSGRAPQSRPQAGKRCRRSTTVSSWRSMGRNGVLY